ncbi:exported protein of unknown function (plasmid) [Caballeronia sp. S22]
MFSTKWPARAACFGALMFVAGAAVSQESHLTLDDIDKLARAKLVDSMRGPQGGQGGAAAPGNGLPCFAARRDACCGDGGPTSRAQV